MRNYIKEFLAKKLSYKKYATSKFKPETAY